MIAIFAMLFILCVFIIMKVSLSLPYQTVDIMDLAKVEYSGFNGDGIATVTVNDAAVDDLLAKVKREHEESHFSGGDIEDVDYANFRQSLSFSIPMNTGLSNGQTVNIISTCNKDLADKLKIELKNGNREATVSGLPDVTRIPLDEVFSGLNVAFDGISPAITVSLQNSSTQPLVSKMIFEIVDAKEYYSAGETVKIHATYTDEMCLETGYTVDTPVDECIREYPVTSNSSYVTKSSDLSAGIIKEAIAAGKKAFTDANEYGVRIFCEANLVPVYIDKKATFTYGAPNYVSSYFKSVFPEKAGELGLAYNDLDIIYDVKLSQADGVSCTAYGAVRFSDIIRNEDGTYSYDFSSPQLLSVSYYSARVKKNVVDSYANSYNIERVYP